ncbi:MAG TPA: collagen-like protein [Salinimicrobium sp.]|nr:collagen-like protein [Salinimicrobium sp.]
MKKYFSIIAFTLFALTSCSEDGPPGPEGPQGPPGEDGLIGVIFETDGLNFTAENEYFELVGFPSDIEVFDSDVVLVYLLEGVEEGTGADIWSLLPQTFYLPDGELEYNYNFTSESVAIFLDGNVDLSTLSADYTDNKIFRIVVVPAGFPNTSSVDVSNFNAVLNALHIEEQNIPSVNISE